MIFVGEHINVVNLVGAVTKHMMEGELYVITELCEAGSLDQYLRKHRATFVNETLSINYATLTVNHNTSHLQPAPVQKSAVDRNLLIPVYRAEVDEEWITHIYNRREAGETFISTSDLISYAHQAANGMEFLASKNIIHRDLAARNLLLTATSVVKITDFGLARQDPTYKIKSKDVPLPYKWTAIESLRYHEYTSKSDVWSFGITMWEIFSLGESPYPGMQTNSNFIEYIKAGNRMSPPPNTPQVIYNLMQSCWNATPSARPRFSQCKEHLSEQLELCSSVLYNRVYGTPSRSPTTETIVQVPNIDDGSDQENSKQKYRVIDGKCYSKIADRDAVGASIET